MFSVKFLVFLLLCFMTQCAMHQTVIYFQKEILAIRCGGDFFD